MGEWYSGLRCVNTGPAATGCCPGHAGLQARLPPQMGIFLNYRRFKSGYKQSFFVPKELVAIFLPRLFTAWRRQQDSLWELGNPRLPC
jgi:hypothetical protein